MLSENSQFMCSSESASKMAETLQFGEVHSPILSSSSDEEEETKSCFQRKGKIRLFTN